MNLCKIFNPSIKHALPDGFSFRLSLSSKVFQHYQVIAPASPQPCTEKCVKKMTGWIGQLRGTVGRAATSQRGR